MLNLLETMIDLDLFVGKLSKDVFVRGVSMDEYLKYALEKYHQNEESDS